MVTQSWTLTRSDLAAVKIRDCMPVAQTTHYYNAGDAKTLEGKWYSNDGRAAVREGHSTCTA